MHGVIRSKGEKCSNINTQCTKKTCISRRKHGKVKEKDNTSNEEIALELLHQRLGHRSTISMLSGYTSNVWEDVELRIDPERFYTLCQIPSINKKTRAKIQLKSKSPFKWFFMDIVQSTAPKRLTSDTTFSNYLLIVDA